MKPSVFPEQKPVPPAKLSWFSGPAPADAANEHERAAIVTEACKRATNEGGSIMGHAFNIANERGVRLDPSRGIK